MTKGYYATMFLEKDTMLSLKDTMTMNSYCLLYKVNHIELLNNSLSITTINKYKQKKTKITMLEFKILVDKFTL